MSFSFRDKPRLSERIRGKSGDELFNELKEQFDQDRKMFFETSPKWGPGTTSASFQRTGFPFDDDMMPRGRQDIRSHLDDLAARHPEFADHLRCPPWGGEVGGTQTRGQMHRESDCDDDARSQASGVSSSSSEPHGPDMGAQGPLPQYGLRNTVDLGQKQQEADQEEKQGRGQRSMSAPPDNRSQQSEQPQRFVSRVEIPMNAAGTTLGSASDAPGKPPVAPKQHSQGHSTASKQGNVRHIPIFVEGRDEPILPKNVAPDHIEQPFAPRTVQPEVEHVFSPRQSQPTHSYARPSQFYPQQTFVQQPGPASPKQQRHAKPQQTMPTKSEHTVPIKVQHVSHSPRTPTKSPSRQGEQSVPIKVQHTSSSQQQPKSQHTNASQQPAKPPSKPPEPAAKDPISRVKVVQKDVEQLRAQVQQYSGTSRKEKEYIYLDEMLTRNLLKLDDIDTEGKENVRQARKEVIKMIQQCISELEAKVPVPDEVMPSDEQEPMEEVPTDLNEETPSQEENKTENSSGHEMDIAPNNNSAVVKDEKQEGSGGETESQVEVQSTQTEPNKEVNDTPMEETNQKNESPKVEGAQEVQDIPMECVEGKGRATEGGEEMAMPLEGMETKVESTEIETTAVNGTGDSIAVPDGAGGREMQMEIEQQEANSSKLQKPENKLGDESSSIPEQQVQEVASSQSCDDVKSS